MNKNTKKLLFPAPPFEGEKETSKKDYTFECKIGDGAFGQVWRIRHKKSGKVFACKQVAKERVVKMIEQFRREVLIMYKINHQNIVKLYHHFEEAKSFYLVMELADGGNLFQKLAKTGKFDEKTAFMYFKQILGAVEYLHSRKPVIIHRDIKPENIILDSDGNLKLTDFGWSNYYSGEQGVQRYTVCGTYEYLCPEMVKESGHTPSVDIWCLGILLFEMVSGFTPFKASSKEILMENISKGKIKFSSHISATLRSLITLILEKDPIKRIQISGIKSHEWYSAFDQKGGIQIQKVQEFTNSKHSKPLDSITNSYRASINAFKEEIEARNEIVKILKTQIKVAIETIFSEERKEGKLEREVLQKRKNLFELEDSIRSLHEKIADAGILQDRLAELQQKTKLQSAILSKSQELMLKETQILTLKQSVQKSLQLLKEVQSNYEDKYRYSQNLGNYLKKLKNKGSVLHKNSQSQISELQISYECLKTKILETESKLEAIDNPETQFAKDLMLFIKENKSKILDLHNFEDKLKQIEDNESLREFELEKIKIEFMDTKKKIIKESWIRKEKISRSRVHNQTEEKREELEKELEISREISKKYRLENIEILHAKERVKVLKLKSKNIETRVENLRKLRQISKNSIEERRRNIESVEMELGILKSAILNIDEM